MRFVSTLAALALAAVCLLPDASSPQQASGPRAQLDPSQNLLQEGIEIEARGPVHEAFAQPVSRHPDPAPIVPKQPPDPIEELPSELKPDGDVIWLPGYWAWDEDRGDFLWVSGIWRLPPPERTWAAGYWHEVDGGWQRVAGYWAVATQETLELVPTPPEPIAEAAPPQPAADAIYAPGCWVWVQTHFAWRPGHWVTLRPGWVWIFPCYAWTPAGYVFIDGHWDYDVPRRGVLFAPVYFEAAVLRRPGWVYRPYYCVTDNFLLTALFVRTGWHHYFFGDYYEARYTQAGYRPWVDYRVGGRFPDPLYSYYRWHNRDNPRWEQNLRATYAGRQEGTAPRPPRTLVQQQKQTTNVNMLVSVKNYNNPVYNMKTVTQVQVQEFRKTAEQVRAFSQKRSQVEVQAAKKQSGGKATAVKLNLPPPKYAQLQLDKVKAPPAPPVPKPTTTVQPPAKNPAKPPVLKLPKDGPPKGKDLKGKDEKPPKDKIEPPKKEPPKIEPPKKEPPKKEPPKIEPPKKEPPKKEPPPKEPPKKEPPPKEPPKKEPPPKEPPKVTPPPKEKIEPPKPPPPPKQPPLPPPKEVKPKPPAPPPPPPKEDPKGKPPGKPKDDKKKDDKKEPPPDDDFSVSRFSPPALTCIADRPRVFARAM